MTVSTSERIFNFSAGPAVLPVSALKEAQRDLVCYPGGGASVMELSHRGKVIDGIIKQTEARLRRILGIPEGYHVLFLQGGATLQFSMVPMNFLGAQGADYLELGAWSKKAMAEARKVGNVQVAWSGKAEGFKRMPKDGEYHVRPEAAYLHMTSNETIEGIQFHREPESQGVPLVCDASSDFLCRPLDISKYAMIYAGAQKNVGPAGVVAVIIRQDLQDQSKDGIPTLFKYQPHAKDNSLYNTPPVFAIWALKLVLEHMKRNGGLEATAERNERKAKIVYDAIEASSGFYRCPVDPACRSNMNLVFRLGSEDLEKKFIAEADAAGMIGLKGHRSVGGCRASLYNAMPLEGAEALAAFMKEFARKNG